MNNKITFLFGAGISIPAGLPSGKQLTDRLLANNLIFRFSSGRYFENKESDQYFDHSYYQDALQEINQHLIDIGIQQPNYEEIYDVCNDLSSKSDQKLLNRLKRICSFNIENSPELCNYFSQFIISQLGASRPLSYFSQMITFCKKFAESNFYTLNHDLLLENFLADQNLMYVNGFGKQKGDIRFWNINEYQNRCRFKIYKLHGSGDWYTYDGCHPVMVCNNDFFHVRDDLGNDLGFPRNSYPHFLTGTTTKIGHYRTEPHSSLLRMFIDNLFQTDILIVSGYSYGDKGINEILLAWQIKRANAKIINISRSKEWESTGLRVEHKDKWFDEFTEDDWNDLGL